MELVQRAIEPDNSAVEFSERVKTRKLRQQDIINKINFINFQNGHVLIKLRHVNYDRSVTLPAIPQPCSDKRLDCLWIDGEPLNKKLISYRFEALMLVDDQQVIMIEPELVDLSENGISFIIPDESSRTYTQKIRRYPSTNIHLQMIQSGALFSGRLIDFNATSLRAEIFVEPPQTFGWVLPSEPVNLIFSSLDQVIYSAEYHIARQTNGDRRRTMWLEPSNNHIKRYRAKEFRSTRQKLTPSPRIIFKHPFMDKTFNLEAIDLSGAGFSVFENAFDSVLLPGMILSNVEVRFMGGFQFTCKVQVVHRREMVAHDSGLSGVQVGLALLDIDIDAHVNYVSLLYHAKNQYSYICNRIDLNELWRFFFDTGFIYPKKYQYIVANKGQIKKTYERLYTLKPNIARHFIFQEDSKILAHMAMVRFYSNSWMIQHHSADTAASNRAGIKVLNQIGRFINDSHRLYSIHMKYVFCYFRPENKFPNAVFGGAARRIRNPMGCSVDSFAYFVGRKTQQAKPQLSSQWSLKEATPEDLQELALFYNHHSNGLALHALDLKPDSDPDSDLEHEFKKVNCLRKRKILALRKHDHTKTIFVINMSDIGLNLSELTNCLNVFVLNNEEVPKNTLFTVILELFKKYEPNEIPVLLYPVEYAEEHQISFDKYYNLWVLSMQHTDSYFKFLKRLIKRIEN